MSKDLFEPLSAYRDMDWRARWKDNHGNWLLAFSGLVCVCGVLAIMLGGSGAAASPGVSVAPSKPLELGEDGQPIIPPSDETTVIRVSGAPSKSGVIRIAVYADAESFNQPELAVIAESVAINEDGVGILPVSVDELPESFAIAAYHDANGDGELNRNLLGIPTEMYGFTNRARTMVGPPEFDAAAMLRPAAGTVVNLPVW